MKLAAAVITLNEEKNIQDCLASLAFCDEVLVVDAGSSDRTAELARAAGARVIVKDWPGHIAQKNFALDAAAGDWVLSVDADERVTPGLRTEIARVLAGAPRADGYSMPRRTWYLGRWILHGGWYPDRKVRLVRKGRARWGGVDPHDRLVCEGPVQELRGDLLHYSYRDISDHLRRIDSYTTIMAREKRKRGGRALPMLVLDPPFKFLKMFVLQAGFLDGWAGFVTAALGSYYVFLKYAKLLELELGLKKEAHVREPAARP